MQLPILSEISQLVTRWKSILDPFLKNTLNDVSTLPDIDLSTGSNVINHMLSQKQQGWFLVDIQGAATVYRSAPFNDKTLTLTSDADVTVSIGVY